VSLHGNIVTMKSPLIDDRDLADLLLDGNPLPLQPLRYLLFNKPRGVVSAREADPAHPDKGTLSPWLLAHHHHHHQPREEEAGVPSGIPAAPLLFPVDRLEESSQGLLLLTNDGALSHALASPEVGLEKTYLAVARGRALNQHEWLRLDEDVCVRACKEGVPRLTPEGARVNPVSMRMLPYREASEAMAGGLSGCIQGLLPEAVEVEDYPAAAELAGLVFVEVIVTEGKKHEARPAQCRVTLHNILVTVALLNLFRRSRGYCERCSATR